MDDYGSSMPEYLNTSTNNVCRALGKKLDLFPSVEEVLTATVEGTHAFIDGTTFSEGMLKYKYEVSCICLADVIIPTLLLASFSP